jgi:hypothetical protein
MKTSYKIALFVMFFIVLAGVLGALHMYNLKHKDLQKSRPDFVITAADLLKAFENDEISANSKYVKKVLEISGTVESVKPGENLTINISLKTESDFSSVICTFQPASNPPDIKSGENIILRGECSGFLTDVLLNNCVIIKYKK